MEKRVGSFINPKTGEEDWIDIMLANSIVLLSDTVTKVGDTSQSRVTYHFDYDAKADKLFFTAKIKLDGNDYSSDKIEYGQEALANIFKDSSYMEKPLDEMDAIKELKVVGCQNLTNVLLRHNIIIGGASFTGLGFVYVENDKMLSIESIDLRYSVDNNSKPSYEATLKNCVGQAPLDSLINPEIRFYTGEKVLRISDIKVASSVDGMVKSFVVTMPGIELSSSNEMLEHKTFDASNFTDEEYLREFVIDRSSLLYNPDDDNNSESMSSSLGDFI
jgi:hypothetical protein